MSIDGNKSQLPSCTQEEICLKFVTWNGDGKPPKISHRMNVGTITVRVATPMISTEVLWNATHIGYDSIWIDLVLRNLKNGNYDDNFGFKISEVVPADFGSWNDF